MSANGRWDLIRRLMLKCYTHAYFVCKQMISTEHWWQYFLCIVRCCTDFFLWSVILNVGVVRDFKLYVFCIRQMTCNVTLLVLGFQYNLLSSPLLDYYLHTYRRTYLNIGLYMYMWRHIHIQESSCFKESQRKFLTIILS